MDIVLIRVMTQEGISVNVITMDKMKYQETKAVQIRPVRIQSYPKPPLSFQPVLYPVKALRGHTFKGSNFRVTSV